MNPDSGMPGFMTAFFVIFGIVFVISIFVGLFKFSQTREMAIKKGATESEATAVALSGDLGTVASFVKGVSSTEDRIREVRHLQEQGLITAQQAEQRVAEILRDV
mgnify:CR=1 FL=1